MSRVTISMKTARRVLSIAAEVVERHPPDYIQADRDAVEELRRAMEPKRKPRKPLGLFAGVRKMPGSVLVSSKPSKAQKREHRASIREAVVKRSNGSCECGCGRPYSFIGGSSLFPAPELDHMFGRGKGRLPESVETCWILRSDCHREKTLNRPDAATWWRKFIRHTDKHNAISSHDRYFRAGEAAAKRLAFVETRSMLGAGLKRSVAPKSGPV